MHNAFLPKQFLNPSIYQICTVVSVYFHNTLLMLVLEELQKLFELDFFVISTKKIGLCVSTGSMNKEEDITSSLLSLLLNWSTHISENIMFPPDFLVSERVCLCGLLIFFSST